MGEAIDFYFSQQQAPQAQAPQAAPPQAQPIAPQAVQQPQAVPQQAAPQAPAEQPGIMGAISEAFTGEGRTTPATESLPELGEGGLLSGEDKLDVAKITPVLMTTTDPRELSKILTSNFDSIGVSEDPEGNLFAVNNKTGARVVLNKPGMSKMDIMQGLGLAAAFSPASAAAAIPAIAGKGMLSGLGRASAVGLASAGTEAGLQASQQMAGGDVASTEDIGLAGLLGTGGQVLGEAISATARAARGVIAPEVKELIKEFGDAGVSLRTNNVLPANTPAGEFVQRYREQLPFLEGPALANQQNDRIKAVGQFLEDIGATDKGHESIILESLKGTKKTIGAKASKQFKEADNIMNAFGPVPRVNASGVIDDAIEEVSAIGSLADPSLVSKLNAIKDAPQGNFGLTRRIRSEVGSMISDFYKGVNTQIGKSGVDKLQRVKNALDDDLNEFATATGNAAGIKKFRDANKTYSLQSKLFRNSALKTVLDKGELVPETITNMLIANKTSQGKLLFQKLDPVGKESARAAIMQQAIKRAGGIDDINPNRFLTQIKKLNEQTGVMFKPQQRAQLKGLQRVLEATTRAQDFLVASRAPTGAIMQPMAAASAVTAGAFTDLGLTLSAVGSAVGLSKAFETKAVRNTLLKLANTKPGSTREDELLRTIMPAFIAGTQSTRTQNVE